MNDHEFREPSGYGVTRHVSHFLRCHKEAILTSLVMLIPTSLLSFGDLCVRELF